MQLRHHFELPAPAHLVFGVFSRLDLLAPCFPGASLWGQDGGVYHGVVKVKLGPFPLLYEGTARVVRADPAEHSVRVTANARERRGTAAGSATVTASFIRSGPDATHAEVVTELDLTGRPARLSEAAIATASDRLARQFVDCLTDKLIAGLTADEPPAPDADQPGHLIAAVGSLRPAYAYRPPSQPESIPHLQVLSAVARPWLVGLTGGLLAAAALLVAIRRLRRD